MAPAWTVIPDSTSFFVIADSAWNFGAVGATQSGADSGAELGRADGGDFGAIGECAGSGEPVRVESADALADRERRGRGATRAFLRCRTFVLTPAGQGTIDLSGITFPSLVNTLTIAAGSLTLFYFDELNGPSAVSLAAGIVGDGYDCHVECGEYGACRMTSSRSMPRFSRWIVVATRRPATDDHAGRASEVWRRRMRRAQSSMCWSGRR